jgi:peptide/nickel transport system ATP-binding protein
MAGVGTAHLRSSEDVILEARNLVVEYRAGRGKKVHAVSDVSFDVLRGETLGLVGESGCGKSTVARSVLQLPPPDRGTVRLGDDELTSLPRRQLRDARRRLQMVFQDPISSLNPRRRVHDVVGEGLQLTALARSEAEVKVEEVLTAVGLDSDAVRGRRAHEFSGGQCQRICIARALVMEPDVIVCDEPVSALDVSVQAQIINLLEDMKHRYGLTLVFIAHDLAVVKNISDRIAVMYLGKLCEVGPSDGVYAAPLHPYTRGLLDAVPDPDPNARDRATHELSGDLPSPIDPPSGCRFRTRCSRATGRCAGEEPELREIGSGHFVACHHPVTENGAVPVTVDT